MKMTSEEKRRHLSALATNVVATGMDIMSGRILQTAHDAETRDAIYHLLLNLQETESTTMTAGGVVPLVANPQSTPDNVLDSIEARLAELNKD
jgi:hypothetical protein